MNTRQIYEYSSLLLLLIKMKHKKNCYLNYVPLQIVKFMFSLGCCNLF